MTGWRNDKPPEDGSTIAMRTVQYLRFKPYKPTSQQARAGIKGRWQQMNEWGGWENCPRPLGLEWQPFSEGNAP